MKKKLASAALAIAFLVITAATPAVANPILGVTIDPNPVVGPSGGAAEVNAFVENLSTTDFVSHVLADWTGAFGQDFAPNFDLYDVVLAPTQRIRVSLGTFTFPVAVTGTTGLVQLDVNFDLFSVEPLGPDDLPYGSDKTLADFNATVPEPVTMSLFGVALAGAAIARRRRA